LPKDLQDILNEVNREKLWLFSDELVTKLENETFERMKKKEGMEKQINALSNLGVLSFSASAIMSVATAKAAGVPGERIESLDKEGLFSPSGLTAGEVPFYSREKLVEITKVFQLLDMGYGSTEVKKIVERVGVPGTRRQRGKLYLERNWRYLSSSTAISAVQI